MEGDLDVDGDIHMSHDQEEDGLQMGGGEGVGGVEEDGAGGGEGGGALGLGHDGTLAAAPNGAGLGVGIEVTMPDEYTTDDDLIAAHVAALVANVVDGVVAWAEQEAAESETSAAMAMAATFAHDEGPLENPLGDPLDGVEGGYATWSAGADQGDDQAHDVFNLDQDQGGEGEQDMSVLSPVTPGVLTHDVWPPVQSSDAYGRPNAGSPSLTSAEHLVAAIDRDDSAGGE